MRRIFSATALAVATLVVPAAARAQSPGNLQVQGFGGITVRGSSTSEAFGGNIAVPLTDNIQVVGEGGRINDIMTPTIASLLDFTPIDMRLSATYAAGGVRVLTSSRSLVRPYGEATIGIARLRTGFGGPEADEYPYVNIALQYLDSTQPILGLGGGLMIQGGHVVVDLGYRFNKISGGNVVQSVLTGGDFDVHQFRFGIGVRF
jgi:opacity protein-like surface antigen